MSKPRLMGYFSPEGSFDPDVDEVNRGFATRAFGPMRILSSVALVLAALIIPQLPNRLFVIAICATSLVSCIAVHFLVAAPLRLRLFGLVDTTLAVLASLVIGELWVAGLIVAATTVMMLSTVERGFPLALIGVALAAGSIPGIVHAGVMAIPIIVLTSAVVFVDQGLKRMVALVEVHDQSTLRAALETSASIVHVSNLSRGKTITVQGPVEEITGYSLSEWVGADHRDLIHPDDLDAFWIDSEAVKPGDSFDRKARLRHKDGSWTWIRDLSVATREADGQLYLRGFTVDTTDIEEAHEIIRQQAKTDQLTGLANRNVLLERLAELTAGKDPFTLYLLDLNRFKLINDTMGHPAGDAVLRQIADRLSDVAGSHDLVCRLGGDEFAVVAPDISDAARAADLAERIASICERRVDWRDIPLRTSAAIGVIIADDGDTPSSLLRQADLSMYRAKADQASFRFFSEDMETASHEELKLSAALPGAIRNGEIELFFQPKVDLASKAVVGFEGLARWRHPELGVLTPNRFLHLIKVSDQEHHFVDHVIAQGIAFAETCAQRGQRLPVSVNLSTDSFLDETLPSRVETRLRHHRVDPEQFIIEITELDIMDERGSTTSVLDRWAALGVGISIDDFGTGYSSFARLVDMPITEIKIDRRFVMGAPSDDRDEIIVRSVADLARRMNIDLVAEGVEESAQADLLVDAGCRVAQGFMFDKPLPRAEALARITDSPSKIMAAAADADWFRPAESFVSKVTA